MSTKYVVSGGYADHTNEDNDKFFQEILKETSGPLTVLIILFAKDEEEVVEIIEKTKAQFERNKGAKQLEYILARHDELEAQIGKSRIVYIHGGDPEKLLKEIRQHPKFADCIMNKVVAGESAGTYLLSTKFYAESIGNIEDGLGILPVKTICHYDGTGQDKLNQTNDDLETLLLKDYRFKVYKK